MSQAPYDPAEAGEVRRTSEYMTKRDLRIILIVVALILLALWPVYVWFRKFAEAAVCKSNLNNIYKAIGTYMEQSDGHFPPAYANLPGSDAPVVTDAGVVITWGTVVAGGVKDAGSFKCPSASESEVARSESTRRGVPLMLAYGMYVPYALELASATANPSRTVLLAETSNMGAEDSYDPLPFKDPKGNVVPYDGFAIGFDNRQRFPDDKTRYVTRLAFPGTSKGDFGEKARGRHGAVSYAMTVEGGLVNLAPDRAEYRGGSGYWAVPVSTNRR